MSPNGIVVSRGGSLNGGGCSDMLRSGVGCEGGGEWMGGGGSVEGGYRGRVSRADIEGGYRGRVSRAGIEGGYRGRVSRADIEGGYRGRISRADIKGGGALLVDAPSDSLIVLSVVDGRGMGVGHLRPRRAAHMCHCGAHVVSLSTPFETRWEMPSSLPPSTVTFRLHYLHARGAGTRSVTHHVNRDEIARVGVRAASGKLIIQPNRTTHIHAPYGHTITLTPTNSRRGRVARSIGRRAAKDSEEGVKEAKDNKECSSSFIEITDSLSTWVTCSLVREPVRSSSNVLSVRARGEKNLYMQVESTGLEEASRACGWGWVALGNRCYLLVEYNATWPAAEASCVARGGNLAAVTGPQIADLLTRVTAAGAKYSPRAAYWVGASDSQYENSFTWTSGAPYSFSGSHFPSEVSRDVMEICDVIELQEFSGESFSFGDLSRDVMENCGVIEPWGFSRRSFSFRVYKSTFVVNIKTLISTYRRSSEI
ncbi:uncharacterized protein LOC122258849 [Penaeus japonicus]|uniref:uncharacterized protein LOC122258849 n=1 Tax=Penaeus japonicus TaxID=27405 RepID=UPI001C714BFE|nr:uncharacterized protein LOC122258849 [Penaeus japonicus]